MVIDADVFLDEANVRAAISRAEETGKVTWAFAWWAGLTEEATDALLRGRRDVAKLIGSIERLHRAGKPNTMGHVAVPDDLPDAFEKVNPVSWSCCFVVPRAVFDGIDGFDERFSGWGWEDLAFQSAVCGLFGWERVGGAVLHLWHPRHPGLGQDGVNKRRNRQLGRRYMYGLRLKGYHDRTTPSDEDEMQRDRDNLLNLMAAEETDRLGRPARDLPDWSAWLPSLEELVASWKERRRPGPDPSIAIVVRSGGPLESWPARSAYLQEMLDSLDRHVQYGQVPARVVFSDWPEAVTPELEAIATAHGFYVVGQGNRGFTRAMAALWSYLSSRTWAYDFAFLVEDDFRFERDVDLRSMAHALDRRPELVQMALLRDACYEAERDAGGILGHPTEAFRTAALDGARWLEHRRFFTLNPTLIRRDLVSRPWPIAKHSEAVFGRQLFEADPAASSALWGRGEAWVTHLGEVRAGTGY